MNLYEKITHLSFVKKASILFILFLLFTVTLAFSYSNAVFSDIQDSIFRLHVIANSNSQEDQSLKYLVRDKVLAYINNLSKDLSSKDELIPLVYNNIDSIQQIAQTTVYENGYNYVVSVDIGHFEFPTKNYGDISLPAGFYDALKIRIGNADGQNWWCVMFPPLCFIDISSSIVPDTSKQLLENEISDEGYQLLSDDTAEANFKFKLVELFQGVSIALSKI